MAEAVMLSSDRSSDRQSVFEHARFKMHRENGSGVLQLATRKFSEADQRALSALINAPLPLTPNSVSPHDGLSIAWVAPGHWYASGPESDVINCHKRWSDALGEETALCINMSDQLTVWRIEGASATELMSSLIPIDFELWARDGDKCLRTALTDFSLFVERLESNHVFRLIADRSYGGIVEALFVDAAQGRL